MTFRAVGEMVGMAHENFKYYPRVRIFLEQNNNYLQFRRRSTLLRENELLAKVAAAIQQLESSAQPLTYLAVSKLVGMHPTSLNRYPRIRTLLVQKVNIHHPHQNVRDFGLRENALLAEVKAVICRLEELGTPVTWRAISEAIGMTSSHLEQYPQIKILMEKYVDSYYLHHSIQSRVYEDDLLLKVESAMQLLKDLGRPVTQHAIGEITGVPANALWRYLRLRKRLEQEVKFHSRGNETSPQVGEEELMKRILEAKSALDSSGQPTTPGAIRKLLGIEASFLKYYPQVNTFLHSLEKQDVEMRRHLHEEELLVQAKTAIQELKNEQQPITQTNIAKRMGCSTGTLHRNPKVLALIMEYVKQERQEMIWMFHQQKEKKIKEDVLEAVQQLQALNQRITIEAICQIVQVSRDVITHYPQVNNVLDAVIN